MLRHCTLSTKEAVWNLRQSLIQEADAAHNEAARIADISRHFHFDRDDKNTHLIARGVPVQLAMTLTERISGRVRTVICRNVGGEWCWLVEDMGACQVEAADLIKCVKQRIGAKLAGQLTGKALVN